MSTLDCFVKEDKKQTMFRHTCYHDPKCHNCHSDFSPNGRNSRVVRTIVALPNAPLDILWSCVKCAKVYKDMLNV